MAGPIHIALTFDDTYWAPAYAVMRSTCLTTTRRADLVFHLCHRPLTTEHKADLDGIAGEFGAKLHYYDLDALPLFTSIAARARYNEKLTNIVYARLILDRLLPADIARVTYLDCDLLVWAPIERIAEIDLEGHPLAAVRDAHGVLISMGRDMRQNRDLFDPAIPYFNAGVMVIDLERWRQASIVEKLDEAIASGVMDRIFYDQDFLNLVFRGDWLELDYRWNFVGPEASTQSLQPYIYHYTGAGKPWFARQRPAHKITYKHVMTFELYYRYRHYLAQKRRQARLSRLKRLLGG